MSQSVSVLVADDHPIFREGLAAVINGDARMHVIAEAADANEVVRAATAQRPDVILMDLAMPGGGGIQATRRIRAADPQARVVILTMSDDDDAIFAALRAGARGYILKDADKEAIRAAVLAASRGDAVFGSRAAERVVAAFASSRGQPPAFPQLSGREREVLDLVAQGLDNATIARRLSLSDKTVRNNVSAILVKLQVADRARAIVAAREAGFGQGPQ